jgi:hypothetical protein
VLDDQVRREVAADGDHRFRELAVRQPAAEVLVDLGVGVVARVERVRGPVDDAVELVDDENAIVQ